jgi:cytoskeleton protein RodZ
MGSFGENLRREREMRGVSLQEISAATKISVRFLQSVENEEFAKLPGGIFVRSFIRSYARYLGLDEEALLAEYQLLTKNKGGPDISRLAASRAAPSRRTRSAWKFLAITVAVAVLLFAGLALWQRSRSLWSPAPSQSHGALPTTGGKPAPLPPGLRLAQGPTPGQVGVGTSPAGGGGAQAKRTSAPAAPGATTAGNAPKPTGTSGQQSGGLTLQIAATERSWVAVDADGKTVLQGVLEPGQVKTERAKKDFDVVAGNAQGIVLTLNGQTLKPLGSEGQVKSVRLTLDDLKNAGP